MYKFIEQTNLWTMDCCLWRLYFPSQVSDHAPLVGLLFDCDHMWTLSCALKLKTLLWFCPADVKCIHFCLWMSRTIKKPKHFAMFLIYYSNIILTRFRVSASRDYSFILRIVSSNDVKRVMFKLWKYSCRVSVGFVLFIFFCMIISNIELYPHYLCTSFVLDLRCFC